MQNKGLYPLMALSLGLAACTTAPPPPVPHHHTHVRPPPPVVVEGSVQPAAPAPVNSPPPPPPMSNSPLPPPQPAPPSVAQPSRQLADGSHVPALQATLATAQSQVQAGDLDGAAITLERAQRMAPQSATVYQRLADVRLRQQRPAEAEQLLRKALGFAATTVQAAAIWSSLAVAEQHEGNAAGAADAQNHAAALQGN